MSSTAPSNVVARKLKRARSATSDNGKRISMRKAILFAQRIDAVYSAWLSCNGDGLDLVGSDVSGLLLFNGDDIVDEAYPNLSVEAAYFKWIFGGVTITNTLLLLLQDAVYVVSSNTKIEFLRPLAEAATPCRPITFLHRKEKASMSKIVHRLNRLRPKNTLGLMASSAGNFLHEWLCEFEKAKIEYRTIPIIPMGLPKDSDELDDICNATDVAATCVKSVLTECISLYESKEMASPTFMSEFVEKMFKKESTKKTKCMRLSYQPRIANSTNATLGLKPRDKSVLRSINQRNDLNNERLQYSAIVCSVGVKSNDIHGNFARTLLIRPSQETKLAAILLRKIRDEIIAAMLPGMKASKIYQIALDLIQQNAKHLLPYFTKNVGHSIGYRFKESVSLELKSDHTTQRGETFNIKCGFVMMPEPHTTTTTTIMIADTVIVTVSKPRICGSEMKPASLLIEREPFSSLDIKLPMEILSIIFRQLDAVSLGRACQVCKFWSRVWWTNVDFEPLRNRMKWLRSFGFRKGLVSPANPMINGGTGHRFMSNDLFPPRCLVKQTSPIDVLGSFKHARHFYIANLSFAKCRHIRGNELHALEYMPHLVSLNLNYTSIGSYQKDQILPFILLGRYVENPECKLRSLELAGVQMKKNQLVILLHGISKNPGLVLDLLRIQENPIGDSGAIALSNFLQSGCSVPLKMPLGPLNDTVEMYKHTIISQTGVSVLLQGLLSGHATLERIDAPAIHQRGMVAVGRNRAHSLFANPFRRAAMRIDQANIIGDDAEDAEDPFEGFFFRNED